MFAALAGVLTLVSALLWQLHGNAFAPDWAQSLPLWAWFVVAMCLESSTLAMTSALALALTWSLLVAVPLPGGTVGFIVMVLCGMLFLRTWLTFRSLWSAYALLVLGQLVFFFIEVVTIAWRGDVASYWGTIAPLAGARLVWGSVWVLVGMRVAVWMRRRLRAYIDTGSRFSI